MGLAHWLVGSSLARAGEEKGKPVNNHSIQ